jgi:hypothetical protein
LVSRAKEACDLSIRASAPQRMGRKDGEDLQRAYQGFPLFAAGEGEERRYVVRLPLFSPKSH